MKSFPASVKEIKGVIMKYLFLFILVSCATPYQPNGFRGGYSESKVSSDMWEVVFDGNGYTSSNTVYNYLKRRCAELTIKNGYTHFIVINNNPSVKSSIIATNNRVDYVEEPSNRATIKMINNPPKEVFAYDAYMVLGKERSPAKE